LLESLADSVGIDALRIGPVRLRESRGRWALRSEWWRLATTVGPNCKNLNHLIGFEHSVIQIVFDPREVYAANTGKFNV